MTKRYLTRNGHLRECDNASYNSTEIKVWVWSERKKEDKHGKLPVETVNSASPDTDKAKVTVETVHSASTDTTNGEWSSYRINFGTESTIVHPGRKSSTRYSYHTWLHPLPTTPTSHRDCPRVPIVIPPIMTWI
jgi:hypothetical protein